MTRTRLTQGRSHNFFGRGLAASYAAGRARVRRLIADRERFNFICLLAKHADRSSIRLSEVETDFINRLLRDTCPDVPDIFCGDANICDSLRRQYEPRLFFNRVAKAATKPTVAPGARRSRRFNVATPNA